MAVQPQVWSYALPGYPKDLGTAAEEVRQLEEAFQRARQDEEGYADFLVLVAKSAYSAITQYFCVDLLFFLLDRKEFGVLKEVFFVSPAFLVAIRIGVKTLGVPGCDAFTPYRQSTGKLAVWYGPITKNAAGQDCYSWFQKQLYKKIYRYNGSEDFGEAIGLWQKLW
jgi:hypothetical protein